MIEHNLWLVVLVVAAFWTALVANSSPAARYVIRAWAGGVMMGALAGSVAGYAAASASPDWQWPVGLVVGVAVGVATLVFQSATKKVT